jgi:hypothetical protein
MGGAMNESIMGLFPFSMQTFSLNILPQMSFPNFSAGIDAIILLAWLWHEEVKHKIKDFI